MPLGFEGQRVLCILPEDGPHVGPQFSGGDYDGNYCEESGRPHQATQNHDQE